MAVSNNYGDIAIYDYSDFDEPICILYEPDEWCEAMQYSPNGKYLAVGSHDNSIYVYKYKTTNKKFKLHYKIDNHFSSAVTALDWMHDS